MKLLIITQKVNINDDDLGFFHEWILEFSKHYNKVTVICLEKGEYKLPENVKVLSLGKEKRIGRIRYLINFYKYIWQERKNYDVVFVHMNKEYVLLGGIVWKIFKKKIYLWYTHKQVSFGLKIAEKIVDKIFTASKKSFRLESKKIEVLGHGIDVEKFLDPNLIIKKDDSIYNIITVGRISPSKDYETLIKAAEILKKTNINFFINIIGGVGTPEQKVYLDNLKQQVKEKNLGEIINFEGPIPSKDRFRYFRSGDLFVHMSLTGSLDKVILEAMVSGLPVISCNDASYELLSKFKNDLLFRKRDYASYELLSKFKNDLLFRKKDYKELAKKIKIIYGWDKEKKENVARVLQKIVIENYNLGNLIKKIVSLCQ